MAIGREITIPQNPANMPPANTAKILTKGCNLFVFPYTLGLIIYPSILGQIKHTINVKINKLLQKLGYLILNNWGVLLKRRL